MEKDERIPTEKEPDPDETSYLLSQPGLKEKLIEAAKEPLEDSEAFVW